MYTNATEALKPNFMSSLLLCAVFLLMCIMHIHQPLLKFHNKEFKTFYIFCIKCCLHHRNYAMLSCFRKNCSHLIVSHCM